MRLLVPMLALLPLLVTSSPLGAQEPPLKLYQLRDYLAKPDANLTADMAERVRAWFGRNNLAKGANPKVDGLEVAWAIELPDAKEVPAVELQDVVPTTYLRPYETTKVGPGLARVPLQRIGTTDLYAGVVALQDGDVRDWRYVGAGENKGKGRVEVYKTHPDSLTNPNAPKGKVTQMPKWESKVFPGTTRDWWVYVPAQYKPENPACVMVFQDGGSYVGFVPTVFDNLIAKGQMPVTVGVFINPGNFVENNRSNRSFEYDTLSDQYARMLLEEILPEVEKTTKLRHDPESRAIAGASSGGICAFTVAWEKPDQFRKVLSWVGSFTNIASGKTVREGGHNYEAMLRKTPKKPIRVFLQDGENDLDNNNGNWPLANQTLAKSLAFAGYDYRFVYGRGGHNYNHGRAILPDSLKWLWRDYKEP